MVVTILLYLQEPKHQILEVFKLGRLENRDEAPIIETAGVVQFALDRR